MERMKKLKKCVISLKHVKGNRKRKQLNKSLDILVFYGIVPLKLAKTQQEYVALLKKPMHLSLNKLSKISPYLECYHSTLSSLKIIDSLEKLTISLQLKDKSSGKTTLKKCSLIMALRTSQ